MPASRHPDEPVADQKQHHANKASWHYKYNQGHNHVVACDHAHCSFQLSAAVMGTREHPIANDWPQYRSKH
eukprot:CAMPEP_0172709272 /NCGR_PEP_ID=MMETSP1074-20121228/53975_1 /TAXON_ID=2916 /ORGANISM="Ceratium fusus, Strain PA161109" /LENGTH=70 /DNA_ID=CAMNT_0013532461 /DNA_START=490 /DNA_END=702 /DNA_ORIENTATION=-